jgi:hypothetical protein
MGTELRSIGVGAFVVDRANDRVVGRDRYRIRWALFTMACMLALGFVTKYSGAVLAQAIVTTRRTGRQATYGGGIDP